jgi:uncharacterized protein (TIGR03083 family)
VGVADDFVRERAALRATLLEVGPDAPTTCGDWTATDLAVHVAIGELRGGWPTAPFRMLVNRGIRIDRVSSVNTGALKAYRRRRGFDWAIERLGRRPPRAHLLKRVVTVSLLEVWAHHEDVLLANGLSCTSGIDLAPVVDMLRRYQRKHLDGVALPSSLDDQARVLSGRVGELRI